MSIHTLQITPTTDGSMEERKYIERNKFGNWLMKI
jgi:hypothetical protein